MTTQVVLETQQTSQSLSEDYLDDTKTLISALSFLSRNLPIPPDVFDAVSSIYNATADDGDGDVDNAAALAGSAADSSANDLHFSNGGGLMADLEDALVKHRSHVTGAEMAVMRKHRIESHIQSRLAELEESPTNRGEDLQSKCLIELYGLKLAELQRKVRSNVRSEYMLSINCAHPEKQLFDWGMMRLSRPSYSVGDAFGVDSDNHLKKRRDTERLSKLEEEEKNRVETKKRKFFAEILNGIRELQLQVQASQKRRKQRNDGVQAWHGRQRQRATRQEKLRFQALKSDDQEAYMKMVEESKNARLRCF